MMFTRMVAAVAAVVVFLPLDLWACTFCDGSVRSRQTLRMQATQARVIVHGQLRNPRFDPKTDDGFTDLHITTVLKDDPVRGGQTVIVIPRYLPVLGDTPTEYLLFCGMRNGKLDVTFGTPSSRVVVEYLKTAAAIPDTEPSKKLAFAFKHLDSSDATVAADAFLEFARAPDSEILKAAGQFEAARIRKLISDSNTPVERLGVFAFILGSCGGATDAAFLAGIVKQKPLSDRASAAFGGLLAGYLLLDPKDGWEFAAASLADANRPYGERLSAIGTVRFFQATRAAECKPQLLRCCAVLLPHGDLADQAIEDLRRWGWWDLTPEILAQFGKPSHAAPIVRRSIVRYALTCPRDDAKAFVTALRQSDPKLVKDVEDMLALFNSTPTTKPK